MKKSILKYICTLIIMLCALPTMGQDYLVLHFKDGTNKRFYWPDVVEMKQSRLDKDGNGQSNFKSQVIVMPGGRTYTYPLAEIDSISFTKVDEKKVMEEWGKAMEQSSECFAESNSPAEMLKQLEKVGDMEGVVDVRATSTSVIVELEHGETIHFSFDSYPDPSTFKQLTKELAPQRVTHTDTRHKDTPKLIIANQQAGDQGRSFHLAALFSPLIRHYQEQGYDVDYTAEVTPDFLKKDMFNYDMVFLNCHGGYDTGRNSHLLATSVELGMTPLEGKTWWGWPTNFEKDLSEKAKEVVAGLNGAYTPEIYGYDVRKELRAVNEGGKLVQKEMLVCYLLIYEQFFDTPDMGRWEEGKNPIFFTSACQALTGNDNLAQKLLDRGATAFYGYDETNWGGQTAGTYFYLNLLHGHSAERAYKVTDPGLMRNVVIKKEEDEKGNVHKNVTIANLKSVYRNKDYANGSLSIRKPRTNESHEYNDSFIEMTGEQTLLDSHNFEYCRYDEENNLQDHTYTMAEAPSCGFFFNYTGAEADMEIMIDGQVMENADNKRTFKAPAALEKGQTIWYQAYTFDGYYYNLGEVKSYFRPLDPPTTMTAVVSGSTVAFVGRHNCNGTTLHGFVYWKEGEETNKHFINSLEEGNPFSVTITLEPDTRYYYQAVCTHNDVTYYGEALSVLTHSNPVLVNGITLSESSLTLQVGEDAQLNYEVSPSNATNKEVTWTSSNESVATVSAGHIQAIGVGVCVIQVTATDGSGVSKKCMVTVEETSTPSIGNHEYVDLGLPSKKLWAKCNVGANSEEEFGGYFAWGETKEKDTYTKESYTCKTVYNNSDKKYLTSEDDAATANWGDYWRTPTEDEVQELLDQCSRKRTTVNGRDGILFTGPNGQSIFLPMAGYCYGDREYYVSNYGSYMTASNQYSLIMNGSIHQHIDSNASAYWGHTVRPIYGKVPLTRIEITGRKSSVKAGDKFQLGIKYIPSNATDKEIKWQSTDTSVATVSESGMVTVLGDGSFNIVATSTDGQNLTDVYEIYKSHEYVDLGLPSGIKWATNNIGANSPEESGGFYAWGETEEKDVYSMATYVHGDGNEKWFQKIYKYNMSEDYGPIDGKVTLDPIDDVAHVKWGGNWRMPSISEIQELQDNCTYKETTLNGINGAYITGPNGKFFFLPYSGYKEQAVHRNLSDGGEAVIFTRSLAESSKSFDSERAYANVCYSRVSYGTWKRYIGANIRAVYAEKEDNISVRSVTLTSEKTEVLEGETIQLNAVVLPENATDKSLSWSSSDDDVASVSQSGLVTAKSYGNVTITAVSNDGSNKEAKYTIRVAKGVTGVMNGYEYVDLGLSVNWASYNVGAAKPSDKGGKYAWGETETKEVYNTQTYEHYDYYARKYKKYCSKSTNGIVDNIMVLEPEDDVAHVQWGGPWRMPTKEEFDELGEKCTSVEATVDGVKGFRITGPNGAEIFMPVTGYVAINNLYSSKYVYYWTSTRYSDYHPYYFSGSTLHTSWSDSLDREYGLPVRPVFPK